MTRWTGLVILAAIIGIAEPVSAQTVGVVLMHGNTDWPSGTIALVAAAVENGGYLVEWPEMCWSYRRQRDRAFVDCLEELEAPVAPAEAARRIRHRRRRMSQGGIAALAFGARHPGLAGIVGLPQPGARW